MSRIVHRFIGDCLVGVILACAIHASASAQASEAKSAARLEAESNRAQVRSPPDLLQGPRAAFPDEEKALGHHGKGYIAGIIGVDGKLHEAEVSVSSGVPALDANALIALNASSFGPAKDARGAPISVWARLPFEFYAYKSDEPGGGAWRYTCRQFVLDMDWFHTTHPGAKWSEHELYTLIHGLGLILQMRAGGSAANIETNESFDRRWEAALEKCRQRVDLRFNEVMLPEGAFGDDYARGLGAKVPRTKRR